MTFDLIRFSRCFPELFGFVLLDPQRLDDLLGPRARGQDILRRFARSRLGDDVAQRGIAIPIMDVEPGFYDICFRPGQPSAVDPAAELESKGWVLGTDSGLLLFGGAGLLSSWRPDDPRLEKLQVPPGWYDVTIRGYLPEREDSDGSYEILLRETTAPLKLTADMRQSFNLYSDD